MQSIYLVSGETGESWLIKAAKLSARDIKTMLLIVATHERTNTVRDKQLFIDQLRMTGTDQRLAYWLEGEIKRRYSVNDLDRAIEAAFHEVGTIMEFVHNLTSAIHASQNPFVGGRVSMGGLFGFGFNAPTFTGIGDLFSKYPEKMGGVQGNE